MRKKYIFIVLLLLLSEKIFSQEYPVKYYSIKDGLANSMVPAVFQDKDGNMWFPTLGGGISKFNGAEFVNYGSAKGLKNELVRAVTQDKNGRMLFGTMGGGIYYMQKDSLIQIADTTQPKEIFTLHTDKKGVVWIAANEGLYQLLPDGEFKNFCQQHQLPEGSVTSVNSDKDGNVWFNYDEGSGLYCYDGTKNIRFDVTNGLTNQRIIGSFHDSDNNTWVSTSVGLFLIENGTQKAQKILAENLPEYYLFDIVEPAKGILLIGTQQKGMLVFDTKSRKVLKVISQKNGLKSSLVFRLYLDCENNVWISNWGEGIGRIAFTGFTAYKENAGFENRIIYYIQSENNKRYYATSNGLSVDDGKEIKPYLRNQVKGVVINFLKLPDKLFCARSRDLVVIDGRGTKVHSGPECQEIKAIVADKKGDIYIAGWANGMYKYNGNRFETVTDSLPYRIKYYYCAYTDSKGELWFGTWDAGILHFDGNVWKQYTTEQGLPSTKVICIAEDKNGNIIAGTQGGGIVLIKNKKIAEIISIANGLPSNSIFSVTVDKNNLLWIGFQAKVASLNLSTKAINIYSAEAGFDGDCVYNSILSIGDTVWIGTNNYLWRYVPSDVFPRRKNMRVYIDKIQVNYQPYTVASGAQLKYNENKISFNYYTTQVYNNSGVKYSYRLLGADTVFSPLSAQQEITFHELSHGTYRFQVKACIANECSDEVAEYVFSIEPPFWFTWWFWSLMTLLIGFSIKLYINYREKVFVKKQKELEEVVRIRTQEISTQKILVEEKNHEITQSIQYARKIQSAILPTDDIFKQAFVESFVLFKPKDIVSGDYYWISDKENYVFYVNADCTGHGVPGGFMSMLGTALLNEIVDERKVEDCGEVLTLMREKIMQALKQAGDSESKDGMDMVLIRIDKNTLEMQYAAANNSLYIVSNKQSTISNEYCVLPTADCQLFELPCDKMPVGVYHSEVKPFRTYTYQLQKGDIIYTYTDGYADQFGGEKGKKYTYKRLREKLLAICNEPMEKQKTILQTEFEQWQGTNDQIDDVCIIGVKI